MKRVLSLLLTLGIVGGLAFAQAPEDTFVSQTLAGGPVSLDPVRAYDSASGMVLQNVYRNALTPTTARRLTSSSRCSQPTTPSPTTA